MAEEVTEREGVMDEALPPEVADELARLGEPTDEFRAGAGQLMLSTLAGVIALLLAGATLVGLIVLLAMPRAKGGSGIAVVKLAGVALFLVATGVGLLRRARSNRGLRVLVFPGALARVQGEQVEVLRWEDVNAVRRVVNVKSEGVTVRTPVQLLLVGRGGREMSFNEGLAGLRELRQLVEQHTLRYMLPPAVEALEAGEAVGFGAVSVSKDGLHHGLETLAWDEFDGIDAGQGLVTVKRAESRRAFCRVEVSDVPNVHVLTALAEHARSRAT
jgi:hypothetical protein